MKRNVLFRNIIAISVSFGAMVLFGTGSSKAVLQSRLKVNSWGGKLSKFSAPIFLCIFKTNHKNI